LSIDLPLKLWLGGGVIDIERELTLTLSLILSLSLSQTLTPSLKPSLSPTLTFIVYRSTIKTMVRGRGYRHRGGGGEGLVGQEGLLKISGGEVVYIAIVYRDGIRVMDGVRVGVWVITRKREKEREREGTKVGWVRGPPLGLSLRGCSHYHCLS
jgi:hypothetical protein